MKGRFPMRQDINLQDVGDGVLWRECALQLNGPKSSLSTVLHSTCTPRSAAELFLWKDTKVCTILKLWAMQVMVILVS